MPVTSVSLRDFRSYREASVELDPILTVVSGANGAGKTNLLEAIYYGCTARSCRTANEREVVRFGQGVARVAVGFESDSGAHELTVGLAPGESKRMTLDGSTVERLLDLPDRPLVSVFLPDRLDLIKGVPALRRAHLDQVVAALWPGRIGNRRAYGAALAQRNALLARIRSGSASAGSLTAWDTELARHALRLMADRREAVERLVEPFAEISSLLGLDGEPALAYRPRSRAAGEEGFIAELQDRVGSDLDRGFTGHGPHRDELLISRDGRELRTYGSQGQQRLGLLALLLAEREVIAMFRDATPLLLLDDVMSELDGSRRAALVELLRARRGQALITTTDVEHVPGAADPGVTHLTVGGGEVLRSLVAA